MASLAHGLDMIGLGALESGQSLTSADIAFAVQVRHSQNNLASGFGMYRPVLRAANFASIPCPVKADIFGELPPKPGYFVRSNGMASKFDNGQVLFDKVVFFGGFYRMAVTFRHKRRLILWHP